MSDDGDMLHESSGLDLAVAHWGEHANGGGDRLAWELARVFEDAPFFVGWRDPTIEPDDIESQQLINGRFLNRALERGGLAQQFAHLLGWQVAEPLREYDVLVTSGNEPLFYVPPDDRRGWPTSTTRIGDSLIRSTRSRPRDSRR